MEYTNSVFIFRRDLRLEDNTGLIAALEQSKKVIPCFIFDPKQRAGPYFSENAFQFMCESLIELDLELQKHGSFLHIFSGEPFSVVREIFLEHDIDAVFTNRDYTPFSIERDKKIANVCKENGVVFKQYSDYLLCEPEHVLHNDGRPYIIFSHFFKRASSLGVRKPDKKVPSKFCGEKLSFETNIPYFNANPNIYIHGGRKNGLKILSNLQKFGKYSALRNIPSKNTTTKLSAHHKFGTISIRESYWAVIENLGEGHHLINELYWRDFFTYIAFYFPHVFGKPFNLKYSNIQWKNNNRLLQLWKEGKTGFPIVDAGMRQLNRTGFMHNRVRMIVASFLTKDLHIDWREGEKYFASKLIDYDPSVNNGNWQWCASTGCDAQPYFRIFNPWIQQKKFDPDCQYIKKWVPELRHLSPTQIHSLSDSNCKFRPLNYPPPIVNHVEEVEITKQLFAKATTIAKGA